jgi:hypothetical protein
MTPPPPNDRFFKTSKRGASANVETTFRNKATRTAINVNAPITRVLFLSALATLRPHPHYRANDIHQAEKQWKDDTEPVKLWRRWGVPAFFPDDEGNQEQYDQHQEKKPWKRLNAFPHCVVGKRRNRFNSISDPVPKYCEEGYLTQVKADSPILQIGRFRVRTAIEFH